MQEHLKHDPVTRVIKYCHGDFSEAQRIYHLLAEEKNHAIDLPDGKVKLTDEQLGEFVERYSSEVEPEIWRSKRWKY